MGAEVKGFTLWWTVSLLSVGSLLAFSSDLTVKAALVEAAAKQDKAAVRSLLKQHADVNASQADGTTALAWAAHWDDLEMADLLIRAGANPNAANESGVTPLSLACANGNAAMVEKLVKAGADPNAAQWTGETALMTCARTGNVAAVKSLLVHEAHVNVKESQRGQTALMWAVAEKHPEVTRALIERGADVRARSKGGFTPMLFAARVGDLDSARILLAAGADVNDATPEDGSALVVASHSGNEALAISLLDKGADPNAADAYGITALHYALQRGITAIAGVPFSSDRFYRPNMPQLVKALLARGANPNARIIKDFPENWRSWFIPIMSQVGVTPFLLAAASADPSDMRVLAASGADPLLATKEGITPLMVAAGIGLVQDRATGEEQAVLEAVKVTVELGANINAANNVGLTAMHGAAYEGENSVVQFLAERGAKLDVKDKFGQTPLSIAEGDLSHLVDKKDRRTRRDAPVHKNTADLIRKLSAESAALATPTTRGSAVGQ